MAPGWLDGRLLDEHGPSPASDAAGVFETVRSEHGRIARLPAHLARLERGARALALTWPPPWEPRAALEALARSLAPGVHALRLTWRPPHLEVTAREVAPPPPEALALLAEPGRAAVPRPFGVKATRRADYDGLRAEALAAGAFDALVCTGAGELVEGTISNLFVAAEGELATPPLACGALPGIVRALILTELEHSPLLDDAGRLWRARERRLRLPDLLRAEEILLTNSVVRVVGLARLGGAEGGLREGLPGDRGPLALALRARLVALESGEAAPRIRRRGPC